MSLIPHDFWSRKMFEMDNWFKNSLDFFDPFDDLDTMLSRNLHWLRRPFSLTDDFPFRPRVADKYRVTIDCAGYHPNSLKTEIKDGKLFVSGREETRANSNDNNDDYSIKEFRKTYNLPDNAISDNMTSFFAGRHLVVEVPLKQEIKNEQVDSVDHFNDIYPRIIDTNKGKMVKLSCKVPKDIDPKKLNVTCKDRDLIIKAEDKQEKKDMISNMYYYHHYRLPENTDLNGLKCEYENGKLQVEAPLLNRPNNETVIPIKMQ
jgi:HSP20 family molecular chaperone IbpA